MEKSNITLDHIGLWCRDLEASAQAFSKLMQVSVEPGGRHDGQGTWNKLVGATNGQYVELIGADPTQTATGPIIKAVGDQADLTSCLAAYRTPDLEAVHAKVLAAGAESLGVQSMGRIGADGKKLSWRLLFIRHRDHAVLPFFIDWQTTPHPSSRLAPALTVNAPIFKTPDPQGLAQLFKQLGVPAQTEYGEQSEIAVSIRNGTISASASATKSLSIDRMET